MEESQSPPGFNETPTLYRGREGWTRPLKGEDHLFTEVFLSFLNMMSPGKDIPHKKDNKDFFSLNMEGITILLSLSE